MPLRNDQSQQQEQEPPHLCIKKHDVKAGTGTAAVTGEKEYTKEKKEDDNDDYNYYDMTTTSNPGEDSSSFDDTNFYKILEKIKAGELPHRCLEQAQLLLFRKHDQLKRETMSLLKTAAAIADAATTTTTTDHQQPRPDDKVATAPSREKVPAPSPAVEKQPDRGGRLRINSTTAATIEMMRTTTTAAAAPPLIDKRVATDACPNEIQNNLNNSKNVTSTATILVSKNKTKTGLPLMMRNSLK